MVDVDGVLKGNCVGPSCKGPFSEAHPDPENPTLPQSSPLPPKKSNPSVHVVLLIFTLSQLISHDSALFQCI